MTTRTALTAQITKLDQALRGFDGETAPTDAERRLADERAALQMELMGLDNAIGDKLWNAPNSPQGHAIISAILGRQPLTKARYGSRANVTSDGFVMAPFVSADGEAHHGAFVGRLADIKDAVILTASQAAHRADRDEYVAFAIERLGRWVGQVITR